MTKEKHFNEQDVTRQILMLHNLPGVSLRLSGSYDVQEAAERLRKKQLDATAGKSSESESEEASEEKERRDHLVFAYMEATARTKTSPSRSAKSDLYIQRPEHHLSKTTYLNGGRDLTVTDQNGFYLYGSCERAPLGTGGGPNTWLGQDLTNNRNAIETLGSRPSADLAQTFRESAGLLNLGDTPPKAGLSGTFATESTPFKPVEGTAFTSSVSSPARNDPVFAIEPRLSLG